MPRWDKQTRTEIQIIRTRLKALFDSIPDYAEVKGDRKIVRFLRGHNHDLEKVTENMGNYLKWWKNNGLEEVRNNIVEGGCDHPLKFPLGENILTYVPQLVLAPPSVECVGAVDQVGSPVCVDQYNFNPTEILNKFSIAEYIIFVTYCLEYRTLILEQMSEEKENAYLASLSSDDRAKHERIPDRDSLEEELPPYGVLIYTFVIRDLSGVGIGHLGKDGQEIIRAVIKIGTDNYPEMMRKCYMINTPWVFNTVWYFVKGLIAQKTLDKISVMGPAFQKEIAKQIGANSIPSIIGGPYTGYVEYQSYPFNRALFSRRPMQPGDSSDTRIQTTVFTSLACNVEMETSGKTSTLSTSTSCTSTSSADIDSNNADSHADNRMAGGNDSDIGSSGDGSSASSGSSAILLPQMPVS